MFPLILSNRAARLYKMKLLRIYIPLATSKESSLITNIKKIRIIDNIIIKSSDYSKSEVIADHSPSIPNTNSVYLGNRKITVIGDTFIKKATTFLKDEKKSINNHEILTYADNESFSNNNEKRNFVTGNSYSKQNKSNADSSDAVSTCSSTEYIPPSEGTQSDSSDELSDEKMSSESSKEISLQNNVSLKFEDLSLVSNKPVQRTYFYVPENSESNLDKDLCPLCFEEVGHFSRHLNRKHQNDEAVRKILKMPLKSKDRRMAIGALRKKGNFLLKQEKNKLKPTRKQKHRLGETTEKVDDNEYFPCINCLGYYKKTYLWRHKKICKSKSTVENGSKKQHLTEAQTFLASTGLLGNYLTKSRLKKDVFGIMRADKISLCAKSDPLICLYGESYLNKHKRKQMSIVASNKIRELARLKLALQNSTTVTTLIEALKPELYNTIIASTKVISGYDPGNQTFKSPSLALHLGTTLKFLCGVARKALISKDPLFHYLKRDETLKNISEIQELITTHWCNDISSIANKVLNEKKWEKPTLLPITEDVQKFKNYVTALADLAFEKLKGSENISHNYKVLTECTLSIVLVFNRKRVGEVQFLDMDTYERNFSTVNQDECLNALSEFEKSMSTTFKRVVVFGKGSKPIPILFTKRMQKFIDLLLQVRRSSDVVPKSNKYIFANPGSTDRWMSGASVLRKFANKCGAKNPELLTSTRFRKQIATILQLMSFEKDEMEQIARFMGHTEKTHVEFYRMSEDIYQTAKVAKVLLLLNAGKGSELKGKSLEEIEIAGEVIDYDQDEQKDKENKENDEELKTNELTQTHNKETDNIFQNCTDSGPSCSKAKGRVSWSADAKKVVLNCFKNHVKNKIAPKKEECITLIRKHLNLFKESDWVRIKTLVYNTYREK